MVRERICLRVCVPNASIFLQCVKKVVVSAPYLEPHYLYSKHNVSKIGNLDIPISVHEEYEQKESPAEVEW